MVRLNKRCWMCMVQKWGCQQQHVRWDAWVSGRGKMINGASVVPTESSKGWAAGLRKRLELQSVRLEMEGGEVLFSQSMGRSAAKERHWPAATSCPGKAENVEQAMTSENGKVWMMLVTNCAMASHVMYPSRRWDPLCLVYVQLARDIGPEKHALFRLQTLLNAQDLDQHLDPLQPSLLLGSRLWCPATPRRSSR